jgi:hypothetical protein
MSSLSLREYVLSMAMARTGIETPHITIRSVRTWSYRPTTRHVHMAIRTNTNHQKLKGMEREHEYTGV